MSNSISTARTVYVKHQPSIQLYTLSTNATTFGELKQDMVNAGIVIDGLSFLEGFTKTEFTQDDAALPQSVMYRGEMKTDLAFMLSRPDKNIKSGACDMDNLDADTCNNCIERCDCEMPITRTRKECYEFIQTRGLKDEIKRLYGRPYTNLSTAQLNEYCDIISAHEMAAQQEADKESNDVDAINEACENAITIMNAEAFAINVALKGLERHFRNMHTANAKYLYLFVDLLENNIITKEYFMERVMGKSLNSEVNEIFDSIK
jgi:hypothetical protein